MTMEQNDTLSEVELNHIAGELMSRYALSTVKDIKLICRSENATFKITTETKGYALRIHRPNYHDHAAIESELAWLDALKKSGISVPTPVACQQGNHVQQVNTSENTPRCAVLFEWMEGAMPNTDTDPALFEQLGELMAKLHLHAIQWPRPSHFKRLVWQHDTMVGDNGIWGDWRNVSGLTESDKQLIEEVLASIAKHLDWYGQSAQRFGLIHADLRLTNLLLHDNGAHVIDFDDCGLGWFMHDAAATISFYEHYPNRQQWINNWLKGYQRIRPLTPADLEILPVMIMQRRIQLLAWVGSHHDTEMAKSLGQDWLQHTLSLCRSYLTGQNHILSVAG